MSAELLINVTPSETRVAMIEGGSLQEIHVEREAKRGIVGNIYKGKGEPCFTRYASSLCGYWS